MKPTDEQLAALDAAGFKVDGVYLLSIMEKAPKKNPACESSHIPSVANAWQDGMMSIRCAVTDGIYGRKTWQYATQQQAFDMAVARVLLGMYDERVEG